MYAPLVYIFEIIIIIVLNWWKRLVLLFWLYVLTYEWCKYINDWNGWTFHETRQLTGHWCALSYCQIWYLIQEILMNMMAFSIQWDLKYLKLCSIVLQVGDLRTNKRAYKLRWWEIASSYVKTEAWHFYIKIHHSPIHQYF